jgi:predicted nucleotidyltransferase
MYQKGNNELKVLSLYGGDYNARFYLREISKLAKLPLKTCQNTLINLEREKILKSKTEGKNKYFGLNLDNINVKSYLLKAEIYKTEVFLEKYPEFKTFLKSVDTNSVIILFGSFAKMKADKNSDIDLFIIADKEEKLPYHLLPHKIHKNSLKEESFRKAIIEKEPLIKEIENNHIILNNHSSYVNIFWGYYGK